MIARVTDSGIDSGSSPESMLMMTREKRSLMDLHQQLKHHHEQDQVASNGNDVVIVPKSSSLTSGSFRRYWKC